MPLNRLSFTAGADYLNVRDRPGFEIDARSRHTEAGVRGARRTACVRQDVRRAHGSGVRRSASIPTRCFSRPTCALELNRTMTVRGRHRSPPAHAGHEPQRSRSRDQRIGSSSPAARDSDSTRIVGAVKFAHQNQRLRVVRLPRFPARSRRRAEPTRARSPASTCRFAPFGSTRIGVQAGARPAVLVRRTTQPYYVGDGRRPVRHPGAVRSLDAVGASRRRSNWRIEDVIGAVGCPAGPH